MKKIVLIVVYIVLGLLIFITFPGKYVASYNNGNELYKKGKYEDAIEQYKTALEGKIPKYKECSVRINYALSICQKVQLDERDQDSIKDAIKLYENAVNILTINGCANENNTGHSKKAEQLKNDILAEIEKLEKLLNKENTSSSSEKEKEQEQTKTNVDTIEEKIQNIKQDATKDPRNMEKEYEEFEREYSTGERVERNW